MDLKLHYDNMWSSAVQKFEQGIYHYDYWLDREDDDRYGLTLLLRPDEFVKENILEFLTNIQSIEPEQYYYPASDIHLTIMSLISCYSGFRLNQLHTDEYVSLLSECIDRIAPISVHFKGITASDSCVMIQGFPGNDQLEQLRSLLREKFRSSKLENSLDKRYIIQTAHLTVLRFRKPLGHQEAWMRQLKTYRDVDFGYCHFHQLEWVFNDWYQREGKVEKLAVFDL